VAASLVAEQKQAGYDLIKVHEGLKPDVYEAIVAAARKAGIPFAGHVTATVGLERALAARHASIEHLDGYLQALVPETSPVPPPPSQVVLGPVLEQIDERQLPCDREEQQLLFGRVRTALRRQCAPCEDDGPSLRAACV
jgi:hypothetical protein